MTSKLTITIFVPLILFAETQLLSQDSESQLEALIEHFYRTGNSKVFLSYRREVLLSDPAVRPGGENYSAIVRDNDKFLFTVSTTDPVISIDDIFTENTLRGFDGENFWELRINRISETLRSNSFPESGPIPRETSRGKLTIISAKEATKEVMRERLGMLMSINLSFKEALSVMQLGQQGEFDVRPVIQDGIITWKSRSGEKIRGVLEGLEARPDRIISPIVNSDGIVTMDFDYQDEVMKITRFGATLMYHILYFNRLDDLAWNNDMYSWKFHICGLDELFITAVKDGELFKVNLSEGLDIQITDPVPIHVNQDKVKPGLFLFLAFFAVAPLVIFAAMRQKK